MALLLIVLGLGLLGLAAAVLALHRRNRDAHQSLAANGHDRAHALDQRADVLQEQLTEARGDQLQLKLRIEQLQLDRRIDQARLLVLEAERKQAIPTEASTRLSDQLVDIATEAQQR